MSTVRTIAMVRPVGRFSTGMERLDGSPEKDRVGRFSTGMDRRAPDSKEVETGRFSTGMELTPPTPDIEALLEEIDRDPTSIFLGLIGTS